MHTKPQDAQVAPICAQDFDLSKIPEEYYERPHVYLKALRDEDPLHRNHDGSVLITRYADIITIWRDLTAVVDKRAFFTEKFGPGPLLEHHTTTMLFRDPPDHDRLRALVNPFFSQGLVNSLKPMIERRVNDLIDLARERGEFDFVTLTALPLTIFVICKILGVPVEDAAIIQDLGKRIIMPLNPDSDAAMISSGNAATDDFKSYLLDHVNHARRTGDLDPTSDIVSALVYAERSGEEISEEEILHMSILMLNGGHESTTNLLAGSLKAILDRPNALAEMRSDDLALNTALEECIRFVSPLQLQGRRITRATTISSGDLEPGTEVIISVGSANWDDTVFDSPEELDLGRKPNPHLGFGAGAHVCIGRLLAKLEASILLPRFVRAFATLERNGPAPHRPVARFRGLAALPLAVR